jgi:putative transposase
MSGMTAYRRLRLPGRSYFFTVALANRGSDTLTREIGALRAAVARTRAERPFRVDAMVILPDHLHAIWTLPDGDADFPTRWRLIKTRFTRAVGGDLPRSLSQRAKGERGLWQRRYWEHCIRDAGDFDLHLRYCWANPVRHGYVERPAQWPYSSIHRDIGAGRVEPEWSGRLEDGDFGE